MREVPGVDLRRECVQQDPRYGARGMVSTCGKILDCSTLVGVGERCVSTLATVWVIQ